ncbi:MAG: hypothetical protein R3D27_12425 [Hyphomicrobiaceae bacterium]
MIIWSMAIAVSVALLVVTATGRGAGLNLAYANMAVAAAMALIFALVAIREMRGAGARGAARSEVAATAARYSGLVYTWGALALAVLYGTRLLEWREWLSFLIAFMVAAGLSLFLSATFNKDRERGREDEAMLKIARYLAIVQLVGMFAVAVGLVIDGKMTRFLTPARYGDWAANNVFFFGAIAVAAISLMAITTDRRAGR